MEATTSLLDTKIYLPTDVRDYGGMIGQCRLAGIDGILWEGWLMNPPPSILQTAKASVG